MLTPSLAAQKAELFPTRLRSTAGGWITNAGIVGSIAGFTVGGIMIDRYGLATTVAALALGLLVSIFLNLKLPETRGMDLVRRPESRAGTTTQA